MELLAEIFKGHAVELNGMLILYGLVTYQQWKIEKKVTVLTTQFQDFIYGRIPGAERRAKR